MKIINNKKKQRTLAERMYILNHCSKLTELPFMLTEYGNLLERIEPKPLIRKLDLRYEPRHAELKLKFPNLTDIDLYLQSTNYLAVLLHNYPNLTRLNSAHTKFDDRCIYSLCSLTNLRSFQSYDGSGYRIQRILPKLENLYLATNIDPQAFSFIAKTPHLWCMTVWAEIVNRHLDLFMNAENFRELRRMILIPRLKSALVDNIKHILSSYRPEVDVHEL